MTLVNAPVVWPQSPTESLAGVITFDNALDGSVTRQGFLVQAPKTGSLTHVDLWIGSITTSQTVDMRLEGVSTDGTPDGTLIVAGATDTGWTPSVGRNEFILDSSVAVTQGDWIWVVLQWTSTAGSLTLRTGRAESGNHAMEHTREYNGSWGAQVSHQYFPNVALRYNGGLYYNTFNAASIASYAAGGVVTEERGNRFRSPFAGTLSGVILRGWRSEGAGSDVTFKVFADATAPGGTALASATIEGNQMLTGAHDGIYIQLSSDVSIAKDTWYRFVVEEGSSGYRWYTYTVDAASLWTSHWGTTDMYYTEDDGVGGWTDTTTQSFDLGLLFSQIDDGDGSGSGGGMVVHPGTNGGLVA